MISNAVRDVSSPSDFIGQLSPTQFVLVTVPANLQGLANRISSRLEQALDYFYPLKDREQSSFQQNRLSVHLFQLLSVKGAYTDLEQLKNKLLYHSN